jgi:hypothetical protein
LQAFPWLGTWDTGVNRSRPASWNVYAFVTQVKFQGPRAVSG